MFDRYPPCPRAGARVGSICTGAFALAHTGLLDGRRATTHSAYAERLADLHPLVQVDARLLYDRAGFGTATSLRAHFRRATATTPLAYRRTFRGSPAA
jgi:transcriptional regulator GlxA family with amidase domain